MAEESKHALTTSLLQVLIYEHRILATEADVDGAKLCDSNQCRRELKRALHDYLKAGQKFHQALF